MGFFDWLFGDDADQDAQMTTYNDPEPTTTPSQHGRRIDPIPDPSTSQESTSGGEDNVNWTNIPADGSDGTQSSGGGGDNVNWTNIPADGSDDTTQSSGGGEDNVNWTNLSTEDGTAETSSGGGIAGAIFGDDADQDAQLGTYDDSTPHQHGRRIDPIPTPSTNQTIHSSRTAEAYAKHEMGSFMPSQSLDNASADYNEAEMLQHTLSRLINGNMSAFLTTPIEAFIIT